jgi:hypothetical protein
VHPAELSDRVISVLEEDLLIEVVGSFQPDRGVNARVAVKIKVPHELIEEKTAEALGGS